jgi:hypothetical protein
MGARKLEAYDIQERTDKENSLKESNSPVSSSKESTKIADVFEMEKSIHAKGNLVFNKPEHYSEEPAEKQTRISVVDKVGEKEISRGELESYITQNKKINKIVIEEVKANDVKRTNLIFDERKKPRKKWNSKSVKASSIESQLNHDFLNNSLQKSNPLKNEFEEAVALLGKTSEKKAKFVPKVEAEEIEEVDFTPKAKVQRSREEEDFVADIDFGSSSSDETKEAQNSKAEEQEEVIFSNLSMEEPEEKTVAEVEISRHEFKRKGKKSLSKLYYKVKNHIELFKLGDSYLRDFNRGIKSLAFNSSGIKCERERTVLGVTSFLNYNAKVTVTVVTDDLQKTLYHNFITDLEEIKKPILNEDISYTCYATQGVEFVEFSEICDIMYQLGNTSFEEYIENFVESSDVVLWDLPELKDMDNKKEVFYPVIRSLESVSLIVKANQSKYSDLYEVKDYFEKYKVPFKGLVLAE